MSSLILWSIDIFSENVEQHEKTAELIRRFTQDREVQVLPVYVLAPDHMEFLNSSYWIDQSLDFAKKTAHELLSRIEITGLKPPHVLFHPRPGVFQSVQALIEFAKSVDASLIIASSHSKKGLERLTLGSFTETLFLNSTIPVMIHNPHLAQQVNLKNILFPTDFSDHSRVALHLLLKTIGCYKPQVHLLHVIKSPQQLFGINWSPEQSFYDEKRSQLEKTAQHWKQVAKQKYPDVPIHIHISAPKDDVCEVILSENEKLGCGLIALGAQSSPMVTQFIGSITRKICRSAQTPIWIIHAASR